MCQLHTERYEQPRRIILPTDKTTVYSQTLFMTPWMPASTMALSHTGLSAADIKPGGATVHAGISGSGQRHVKTYRVCGPSESRQTYLRGMGRACCRTRVPTLALTAGAQDATKIISSVAVLYMQGRCWKGGEYRPSFYDDTARSFPSIIIFHTAAICYDVWRNEGVRSANEHAYK